ncbi:hypothetical protein [Streptomyces sp. NPDC048142]|uniref:hypothetical protein n=1 Tax=Streptomyces sp. NPDC048142 TaxID=3365501 RepID=UPI0037213F99
MTIHIGETGQTVEPGQEFTIPSLNYTLTYIRTDGDNLILRDSAGEFTRPIREKYLAEYGHRLSNTGESVGDNPDFKTFSPSTFTFKCADCEKTAPVAAFREINCKPDAADLALLISTQSGEAGQPGSWDDPGVAMELAELVLKEKGLK